MQVNASMKADDVSFHGRGSSESGFETSDGDIHAQQRPGGAQPRHTDENCGNRIRHLTRRRSTASAITPAAATTLPPGFPTAPASLTWGRSGGSPPVTSPRCRRSTFEVT